MNLFESIVSGRVSEAKKLIEDRLEQIVFDKLTHLKKDLAEDIVEGFNTPNIQRLGRAKIVKVRVRAGKVQRRKKLSATQGYTFKHGKFSRMSPIEKRRRQRGARLAKFKRRGKMSLILRKRKFSLRKRKSLGL